MVKVCLKIYICPIIRYGGSTCDGFRGLIKVLRCHRLEPSFVKDLECRCLLCYVVM
jgi:hypothetical protein